MKGNQEWNTNNSTDSVSLEISTEEENESDYDNEKRPTMIATTQDIWNRDVLCRELEALPDGEALKDLINNEETIPNILNKNRETAFLLAAWYGKVNILKILLNKGICVDTTDKYGRTALHLTAYNGHYESTLFLLQNNAQIDIQDKDKHITPLHCAASTGHVNCLRLLIKHGANVNVGIEIRSPLHYAVQSMAVDCMRELLLNKAIPNTPQVYSEAPLHVASGLGNYEAIKLLLEFGAAVNVQSGPERLTPLHLAAEQGYTKCVKLLIDARAAVNAFNRKKQTALHLATMTQCIETMTLLLNNGANPNIPDTDGRTSLHCSTISAQRSCDCVRILLDFGADPNRPDAFGYTPMHLATLNEFSTCVMLLIQYGGDVTAKNNGGISVLTFITKKIPEVIPKYISKFDNSIRLNEHDLGDVNCQLKLDFRVLVPTMGKQETLLLVNFIEVGHKTVLEHPLCKTFLHLKWKIIRKFFLLMLFFHAIFVMLFSIYVIGIYLKDCPSSRRHGSKSDNCLAADYVIDTGYAVLVLNVIMMSKELFQICHDWHTYIKEWENWLQWIIIITVFCCVQPMHQMNIREYMGNWQHHVAAVSIFLTWLELMIIVGRFPAFGLYVQMFTTVAINFSKFMFAYFFLFIAYSLAFGVLFPNYPAFKDLKWVFIKVIIMMSGELEYEDVFYSDIYDIKYPYTAHIAYLGFVLLVTIILTNLMVGLAVNDIQGLQKSAGLDRLVRQVVLMSHLESILFSKLLKWISPRLMTFLHKNALLIKSQRDWTMDIKPNDPRERKLPKNLIESVYQVVLAKKEKMKNKSFRKSLYSSNTYLKGSNYIWRPDINCKSVSLLEIEQDIVSSLNKIIKQKFDQLNTQLTVNSNHNNNNNNNDNQLKNEL